MRTMIVAGVVAKTMSPMTMTMITTTAAATTRKRRRRRRGRRRS